eukprot:tig00020629_g12439.t1
MEAEQQAPAAADGDVNVRIAPIQWKGPEKAPDKTAEELAAMAEKHKKRAEKFGVEFKEPKADLFVPPKERKKVVVRRHGFATGIDLMSEEEKAKREARAKKFNIELVEIKAITTDPELEKRRQRASKFGPMRVEEFMDVEALAEQRKDWDLTVPRIWESVHVYGTDDMSTADVLAYFKEFGPSWVTWINDSSCNVVFEDRFSAKRALFELSTVALPIPLDTPPPPPKGKSPAPAPADGAPAPAPAPSDDSDMAVEPTTTSATNADADAAATAAAAAENTVELCCWRQGFDGAKGNKLLLRFATKHDVKPPVRERKPSLWSRVPALRMAAEDPSYNPAAYEAEQQRREKKRAKRARQMEKRKAKKARPSADAEMGEVGSPISADEDGGGAGGGSGAEAGAAGEGAGAVGEPAGATGADESFVEVPPTEPGAAE